MNQRNEKTKTNEKLLPLRHLVLFLLCAACIALEIVVFSILSIDFIADNRTPLLFLACLITVMTLIVGIIYIWKGNVGAYKLILSLYSVTIFFLVIFWLAESLGLVVILRNPNLYERYLKEWGVLLPVVYIALQVVQVLFLPVPILFSILTGLRLFGLWGTFLYVFIGVFIGSAIAFFIGRKWGNKGVSWLVGEEKLSTWQKKLRGKDGIILAAMFLFPFFPDDLLCLVAGVSTVSASYFLIMMSCTRAISILGVCLSVEFIPFNTWWGLAVWGVMFVLLAIIFLIVYKNIDNVNDFLKKLRKN